MSDSSYKSHPYSTEKARAMATPQVKETSKKETSKKEPAVARPSSSVILVSPANQILLLHRVSTSSSFASAHVFPGGNCDAFHDGEVIPPEHPDRHVDSDLYRLAAIRETFEESGILLAKDKNGRLIEVEDKEREAGRTEVHDNKTPFPQWLQRYGGTPDTDGLIPFTRWVTPAPLPKRFTTQMYIYFLPLASENNSKTASSLLKSSGKEAVIPTPTSDGGKEHTAAQFLPASTWLTRCKNQELILFPPQFTLLYLVAQFLNQDVPNALDPKVMQEQRDQLIAFAKGGSPLWKDVCICPQGKGPGPDGRMVLSLDHQPPELEGSGRVGCKDYSVLVKPTKQGFRDLDIVTKEELAKMAEEKGKASKL